MTILTQELIDMRRPVDRTPFNQPDSVPVIQGPNLRSGIPTVVGFMPTGTLIPEGYTIPWYDTRTKKGYQRQPQEPRINSLASDLRKDRTDLPTAVLLNIRNRDAKAALDGNNLRIGNRLIAAEPLKFYVVDGQHRILALEKLMAEDSERWSHFMIPFVCLLGATEDQEMEQFYIVNSTAKSVKTDLALALLRRRAEGDDEVYEALQEKGKEWQVIGQALVERLAVESQIWKNRVRLPSMEKGDTTIPSASMVTSLKPVLSSPYFGRLKPDQHLKIIEAYWRGIREVLRPAFDDPEEYVLQKGVGVIIMHMILPSVVECIRNKGLLITEHESYARVLEQALTNIQGENTAGETVSGIEFWKSGPSGAAGNYSSSAGRRFLATKLQLLLPEIELE
jgi:DGQHR domain-containing protein